MSMVEATSRCPSAIVVPPRMDRYAAESERFFGILARFSPRIEGLSLDEAFLDIAGLERLMGDAAARAQFYPPAACGLCRDEAWERLRYENSPR